MKVKKALEKRRAYRALKEVEITDELIADLAEAASLAPSCYNNQPWRYVFVHQEKKLKEIYSTLSDGNQWAEDGSMIIAVFTNREDDCIIKDRDYYLFDTGLATANLMLRATELGLVTHPMAGYDQQQAEKVLNIPQEAKLITLIALGKHDKDSKVAKEEAERPQRLALTDIAYENQVD